MRRAQLLAVLILALAASGCSWTPSGLRQDAAEMLGPPVILAPTNQAEADEQVRDLKGRLKTAEERASAYRLEGVRRVVTWACALAALVGIVGAGAAIFMRSKTLAMIPVACIGMVAMGLTTNVILDHPWLTMGGLAAMIAALAGIPAVRHRAEAALRKAGK